jgi:hypothetical protein
MPDRPPLRTPGDITDLVDRHLAEARHADDPWPALEQAHLLSQPWAWPHTRVHMAMLRNALRQRDRHETIGQIVRLIVAGPGSLAGKYPSGNNGRTTMRLTETAPVPADIAATLAAHTTPDDRTA